MLGLTNVACSLNSIYVSGLKRFQVRLYFNLRISCVHLAGSMRAAEAGFCHLGFK